jgi:hypothetical protein
MPAEHDYAAEQERLAEGGSGDDISLPIPKAPEVRPEVYQDVIPLIFRGFLVLPSEINGVLLVWKSLNQHEFEMARLASLAGTSRPASDRFWDVFLGYSLFMIEGVNVLPEREKWMPEIRRMSREMAKEAKQAVVRNLSELNRKASLLTALAEAYALESYSRFRWSQIRGMDPAQPSVTGVPGTERIGLGWAQLTWRALNQIEDTNVEHERAWENAKFIGSCMAGKGVQKIYSQDHDRHRREAEDRTARKDALLRHVFEGKPIEDTTLRDGRQVIVARTVEDLADQMARDLRGEKDWHDQVVDAHMERQRAAMGARQAHMEALARRNDDVFQGHGVQGTTSLAGLTGEEVARRVQQTRQEQAQAAHRMMNPEATDERMVAHQEKWGLVPDAPPPMPPREVGKPFRRP